MSAVPHPVAWTAPRPLWSAGVDRGLAPSILRFASDDFMERLIAVLDNDPVRLRDYLARPETWRSAVEEERVPDLVDRVPLPGPMKRARLATRLRTATPAAEQDDTEPTLKLYQPAHQRYYVAAATLACAIPGLPDRQPAGPHEQLACVIRRILPGVGGSATEHAFVKDGSGARWRRLSGDAAATLAPGEERGGVFPLAHSDSRGLRRTVWGALIPVGKREEYLAAPLDKAPPTTLLEGQIAALVPPAAAPRANSKLARLSELRTDFVEPWKALVQSAIKAAADIAADTGDNSSAANRQKQLRERNLQYQTQSWLLLADLWGFLGRHLPKLRDAVRQASPAGLSASEKDVFDWLFADDPASERQALRDGFKPFDGSAASQPDYASSPGAALRALAGTGEAQFEAWVASLEANELLYTAAAARRADWPSFHYLLAGIGSNGNGGAIAARGPHLRVGSAPTPAAADGEIAEVSPPLSQPAGAPGFDLNQLDRLTVMIGRALPVSDERQARALPFAQQLSQTLQDTDQDSGLFVVRFVHLNEDCGPLHPPTLSEPSARFRMASFFDPDAPARPIRITLPMDTSPAGLRKHAKGTAFVLSNMLCGQVQRAKGLGFVDLVRQVLPWPLHKDIELGDGGGCKSGGIDIGMICSISIPIITLCALLLLMIIVTLLDFIFRWIPWFIMCFPVPGLKGKPGGAS